MGSVCVCYIFVCSRVLNNTVTRQVLIAAEGALKYVLRNPGKKKDEIQATFFEIRIDESQYTVLAGFNEELIQSGFGYLEEMHTFCRVEIPSSPHFLTKLGKILTPYPGVVFTPSSIYKTPVFKDDGTIWDYDDLSLHCAETLSTIPAEQILQSKRNAFASRTESQLKISVTEVGRSGVGGDDYFDKFIDSPEDAEDAGNRNSSTPGSSFRVQTEVFKGTHL